MSSSKYQIYQIMGVSIGLLAGHLLVDSLFYRTDRNIRKELISVGRLEEESKIAL